MLIEPTASCAAIPHGNISIWRFLRGNSWVPRDLLMRLFPSSYHATLSLCRSPTARRAHGSSRSTAWRCATSCDIASIIVQCHLFLALWRHDPALGFPPAAAIASGLRLWTPEPMRRGPSTAITHKGNRAVDEPNLLVNDEDPVKGDRGSVLWHADEDVLWCPAPCYQPLSRRRSG